MLGKDESPYQIDEGCMVLPALHQSGEDAEQSVAPISRRMQRRGGLVSMRNGKVFRYGSTCAWVRLLVLRHGNAADQERRRAMDFDSARRTRS